MWALCFFGGMRLKKFKVVYTGILIVVIIVAIYSFNQFKGVYLSKLNKYVGDGLVSDSIRLEIYKDLNYAIQNGNIERVQAVLSAMVIEEEFALKSSINKVPLTEAQIKSINKAIKYRSSNRDKT